MIYLLTIVFFVVSLGGLVGTSEVANAQSCAPDFNYHCLNREQQRQSERSQDQMFQQQQQQQQQMFQRQEDFNARLQQQQYLDQLRQQQLQLQPGCCLPQNTDPRRVR